MIPVSKQTASIDQDPRAVVIKEALEKQEAAKVKKEELLKEAIEKLANLNVIENLMEVYNGGRSQEQVFGEIKSDFQGFFKSIAEQEQAIKEASETIAAKFGDFKELKATA